MWQIKHSKFKNYSLRDIEENIFIISKEVENIISDRNKNNQVKILDVKNKTFKI